jgi:hypothetical protein
MIAQKGVWHKLNFSFALHVWGDTQPILYSNETEGNQRISLTGSSLTLKAGSHKPPETVSEIEKLKNFDPLAKIGKLMNTMLIFADKKTIKILLQSSPHLNSAIVAFTLPPPPLTKILNETLYTTLFWSVYLEIQWAW